MEAAIRKGRNLPKWYLDEPPTQPLDDFYLRSFWDLNSTRQYEFGPVPWDKIVEYGCHLGLDADIIDSFVALIRAMDAGFLQWAKDETDRQREIKTKS